MTNGAGGFATKVPWPGLVSTSVRLVSHLMASRIVLRDARYFSLSCCSVGSLSPEGSPPDSICSRRSWAICRYRGSVTLALPGPRRSAAITQRYHTYQQDDN